MPDKSPSLKLGELLNRLAGSGQDTQDVEADLEYMLAIISHNGMSRKVRSNVQSC